MSNIQSPTLSVPVPSLSNPNSIQPKHISGELLVSKDDEGKLSVLLILWVAFHHSLTTQEDSAQVQSQQMQSAISIENDLITQLQGLNYSTLAPGDTNMGDITRINANNQITQAQVSVVQDKNQTIQQLAQIYQSQAATSGQLASQTLGEAGAVYQMITDITGDVTGR